MTRPGHMSLGGPVPQGLTGGWSASGTLRTGNQDREVSLQCNFPIADAYTVEFNLYNIVPVPPAVNPLLTIVRAQALVTWSVEGNAVTRRITVGNGVSLTGVGAACKVVIKDISFVIPDPITLIPGIADYVVSMQVSRGPRAALERPLLEPSFGGTVAGGFGLLSGAEITLLAGADFLFQIPNDAGVIDASVVVGRSGPGVPPIPDQGALVQHFTALPPATSILKSYDPRVFIWVPVAPGTGVIRVANQDVDAMSIQCTFGVDG